MQIPDSYNQKNSLFNAMNRFIGAVNNMDQTVMLPSLLRDVPLDDRDDLKPTENGDGGDDGGGTGSISPAHDSAYFQPDADMYSSYILLKSIRNDIEWGVVQGEELRKEKAGVASMVVAEEDDLEKQFHFHLNGLHAVLSKLTHKANTLTNRYKEEIGCGN